MAVRLIDVATEAGFDPLGYLIANTDVLENQPDDVAPEAWALNHFLAFGKAEGRSQFFTDRLPEVQALRERKAERFPGLERHPFQFAGQDLSAFWTPDDRLPIPFDSVSSWGYDGGIAQWIDGRPDALFLDVGAGLTGEYRHNVVYAEIATLPTVDVLCFGDQLPFDEGTFDGIVCQAVLEHCPDPWAVAAEMLRVLRPGGQMVVLWPFLEPIHGYPNHYFNATPEGAKLTFERLGCAVVATPTHPIGILQWILRDWTNGLPEEMQEDFRSLTIGEILSEPGAARWISELQAPALVSGTRLEITKP
jgi:SAM-dependent methyltransferase